MIAAGAIETARLLLNSRSKAHVAGFGNGSDQVGRYLQGHLYSGAVGLYRETVQDCEGPGVSIATCEFNHGNPGIIGGGMLGNEFVPLPIHFWNSFAPSGPRWGRRRSGRLPTPIAERWSSWGPYRRFRIPDSRVTLDPSVRDRFGIPVRVFRPGACGERAFGGDAADEGRTVAACGRRGEPPVVGKRDSNVLSAGQHQAGTCRMGTDPRHSVTDREGGSRPARALRGGGSLHVTNGGFNPVLTIIANAFRIGASLADALRA